MKALAFSTLAVFFLSLTSCELVGDIFQAGMWTGLIVIVLVVVVILWLVNRIRRK
jgi:hypothetical protein